MEILKVDEDGVEYEVEGTFELEGEEVIILIYPQDDGKIIMTAESVDCDYKVVAHSYSSDYSMIEATERFISDYDIFWVE